MAEEILLEEPVEELIEEEVPLGVVVLPAEEPIVEEVPVEIITEPIEEVFVPEVTEESVVVEEISIKEDQIDYIIVWYGGHEQVFNELGTFTKGVPQVVSKDVFEKLNVGKYFLSKNKHAEKVERKRMLEEAELIALEISDDMSVSKVVKKSGKLS